MHNISNKHFVYIVYIKRLTKWKNFNICKAQLYCVYIEF